MTSHGSNSLKRNEFVQKVGLGDLIWCVHHQSVSEYYLRAKEELNNACQACYNDSVTSHGSNSLKRNEFVQKVGLGDLIWFVHHQSVSECLLSEYYLRGKEEFNPVMPTQRPVIDLHVTH